MPVYYFEGSPIVAPFTIESNEPTFVSDTISLKQQSVSQGAQRWELKFQIQTRDIEENYFVSMVSKATEARSMIMPQLISVDSRVTCTVQGVSVNLYEAGESAIQVSFSQTGKLVPKGSFIKFANHSKIYLITNDVNTNGGTSTVTIFPTLRTSVGTGTIMYHPGSPSKPTISYYQSKDTIKGITYEDGILVNPGTIKLVEAL